MVRQKDKPVSNDKNFLTSECELILFNDDVNSFDYVIDTLVEVCDHEFQQAEQCAFIAHYKGRCQVKSGSFIELKPKYDELSRRGLTVSIDSIS